MKDDIFTYHWKPLREMLWLRWQSLSPEDIAAINGKRELLVRLLVEKFFYTHEEAEEEVEAFVEDFVPLVHPQPG